MIKIFWNFRLSLKNEMLTLTNNTVGGFDLNVFCDFHRFHMVPISISRLKLFHLTLCYKKLDMSEYYYYFEI